MVIDEGTSEGITFTVNYKQKVMDFLRENRNLPVLRRIYNLQQLTTADIKELERILWKELGTKEDYDNMSADMECGNSVGVFIRSQIGIDREEGIRLFSEYLTDAKLNADQEEFLNTIVSYVNKNGDITREILVNVSPFDEWLPMFYDIAKPLSSYVDKLHNVVMAESSIA